LFVLIKIGLYPVHKFVVDSGSCYNSASQTEQAMTAQEPEILIYRNRQLALFDQPLYPYLRRIPKRRRPIFAADSTSRWRGYTGTWEIRNRFLTLIALEGNLRQGDEVVDATLELVFPHSRGALTATWFTGEIRCVEGRCLHYAHMGYASEYERDRVFEFEKGRLVSEFLVLNPPPPVYYQIHDDGTRTCKAGMPPNADTIEDPLDGKPFEAVYEEVWAQRPSGEEYFGPLAWTQLSVR
jgi:hypothetical protein